MDNQIKTSFIPRKPIQPGSDVRNAINSMPSPRGSVGKTLFSLVATLIFLAVCGAYAGTFIWEKTLNAKIVSQRKEMQQSLEVFDERFIKQATRLDNRIKEASKILANHVSPSTLYSLISQHTLESVEFSSFAVKDLKNGVLELSGQGQALRYDSIVQQSDEFAKSGFLRNILFTNLGRTGVGVQERVSFTFESQLDPRLILYREKENLLTTTPQ